MKLSTILEAGFVKYSREEDEGNPQQDVGVDDDQSIANQSNPNQNDGDSQPSTQDPDRQGSIRTIPDAHLVYKRKTDNNLYEELWIYKQNQHDTWTMKTYDAIIAGSDIPKGSQSSEDGTQTVERWEVGDPKDTLVFVHITGLVN